MSELATIVRAIRSASGITQESLARFLGVGQTAVSQWETGETLPSVDILMVLHGLADGENQARIRRILLERMDKVSPMELDDILSSLQIRARESGHEQLVGTVLDSFIQRKKRVRRFIEEARRLVESEASIHPAIPEMIRLYREHAQLPGMRSLFWRALGYIDMEIQKRSGPPTASRGRRKRPAGQSTDDQTPPVGE